MCAIRNIDCLLKRISRFTSVDHITVSKSDLEQVILVHSSYESHPHIKLFWPFFALDPKSHIIQMTEYHGRHNTAATKGLKIARWLLISGTFVCFLCHCHFVACLKIFNMITAISKYFSKFCEVSIMISYRVNINQELTTPYGNMPTSAIRLGQRHMVAV